MQETIGVDIILSEFSEWHTSSPAENRSIKRNSTGATSVSDYPVWENKHDASLQNLIY